MKYVKAIAVFQILGGIHGFITLIGRLFSSAGIHDDNVFSYALFITILCISVLAGILLWSQKRMGFILSMYVQLLQAIRFTFGPVNYGFNLFISLGLGIEISKHKLKLAINFEFLETYLFFFTKIVYRFNLYLPFHVVINVSSLLCFLYLYFMYDKLFPMKLRYSLQET